jgi:hypothetical protein
MTGIEAAVLLGVLAVLTVVAFINHNSNSNDVGGFGSSAFETDDIPNQSTLRNLNTNEYVQLIVYRQSGNMQRQELHETLNSAYRATQAVFRRAKADGVRIYSGNETAINFQRSFYHGRGTQEGKRIGSVVLEIVVEE